MKLTKEYVNYLYSTFKKKAEKAIERGKYDEAVKYLTAATHTAYTFYIGFRDDATEDMLVRLSEKIQKRTMSKPFQPNRVVFFDTFSQDAQGLSMQYLDAIIAAGWEILYITTFNLNDPRSQLIKRTLREYDKAQVIAFPSRLDIMERVQFIYDTIMDYQASKLFMQISPSSCLPVIAFYALPREITRYLINLTDHTYWVGAGCMDYIFDWRQYGASLSAEQRGLRKEQIFMLPYYPMMKETPFNGFPKEAEGKVKIFAGASYYKIIDEQDTFFRINKAILDANPAAVTLFAGGGDAKMLNSLIEKYGLQGRFIPIGQRNDIFQCFKHADIYLNTYPLFGGLMGQFAAHAGLPILALRRPGGGIVEESVCQKSFTKITCDDLDDLVVEATRLVQDEAYRHQQGEQMQQCVISIDDFNHGFVSAITTSVTPYPVEFEQNVNFHYLNVEDKLKLENKTKGFQKSVYLSLGFAGLITCPRLWFDGFKTRMASSRIGKFL